MMRRGLHLTPSSTYYKHEYSVVNVLVDIVYYTSYIKMLSLLRADTMHWNKKKNCSLICDLVRNLSS
jgi:hypothetical protein